MAKYFLVLSFIAAMGYPLLSIYVWLFSRLGILSDDCDSWSYIVETDGSFSEGIGAFKSMIYSTCRLFFHIYFFFLPVIAVIFFIGSFALAFLMRAMIGG